MTIVKLPIQTKTHKSLDGAEVNDNAQEVINCYRSPMGSLIGRPALIPFSHSTYSDHVDGLFYDTYAGDLIAINKSYAVAFAANGKVTRLASQISERLLYAAHMESASTQYLSIADNASLSITGNITICCWVKLSALAGNHGIVSKLKIAGNQQSWSLIYYASTNRFRFAVSSNGSTSTSVFSDELGDVAVDIWYFIACRYDGSNIKIFVNGNEDSEAFSTGIYDSTASFMIGRTDNEAGHMDGDIACVGIWSAALTDALIERLYNYSTEAGGAGELLTAEPLPHSILSAYGLDTNLVSYWNLDEASGTRYDAHGANDLSDNNGVSQRLHVMNTVGSLPPTFVADGDGNVFVARGGRIARLFPALNSHAHTIFLRGDAPSEVTHIAYLDSYVLALQKNSKRVYFSDIGDSLTWQASSFFSAVGDPDNINAMHVLNREIFLFGLKSLEVWENDGTTPFSRVPGGFYNVGCSAPYSVIEHEGKLVWLSHENKVVQWDNGKIVTLSTPYSKRITELSYTADCRGSVFTHNGCTFFLWSFPAANTTIVYNVTTDDWSSWTIWNEDTSGYDMFPASQVLTIANWGETVIACPHSGLVHKLDASRYYDVIDPVIYYPAPPVWKQGQLLRRVITGHIDHGTSAKKKSKLLRLRVKRGDSIAPMSKAIEEWTAYDFGVTTYYPDGADMTPPSTEPALLVRHCDDGKHWSEERVVSLGWAGERDFYVTLRQLGIYRSRQWEFSLTDRVGFVLADAEEDVEVLDR